MNAWKVYLKEIWVKQTSFRSFFYCQLFDQMVPVTSRILDIGAGQGRNILSLKRFGYNNLFAHDIGDYFWNIYKQAKIPLEISDLENGRLPYTDESMDVIIFSHVIEHLHSIDNALTEMHRILAPNGLLFIETPDYEKSEIVFWNDYTHVRPYTKAALSRISKAFGFKTILLENSQISDFLLNTKWWIQGVISGSIFQTKQTSPTQPNSLSEDTQMDLSPIEIPYSINLLYKYLKPLFFWGNDMIAVLQKPSDK
jgi:SAM-dependent methyltransferase